MEKSKYKKKQGSILIGVIIIFLMISSLSVAIISRSLQGTILTTDSKKGYIAYQNSDKNTESFLNAFKTLDNEGSGNKIPENSNALNFCSAGSATCSNVTGGTTVADIFSFKAVGDQNQGATRAISAPVPERIDGKLAKANLTVTKCDGTNCGTSFNSCDILVKVNPANFDSNTMKNYEVRKSVNSSLAYGSASGETYGWQKVIGLAVGGYFDASNKSTVIKNGDIVNLPPTGGNLKLGGQYGQTYYFSFKARNKNPFTLDSLYLVDGGKAPSSVVIAPKSCSGGDSLSNLDCIATGTNPAGTETYNQPYNCCNGTECYHPSPNWKDNPTLNCALQKCVYSGDGVGINPTGDSTSGYCRTSQVCQEGRDCTYPYRTVAYCTATPVQSAQIPGSIVPTNWSFQQYQDVYMSPSSNKSKYPNPGDVPYGPGKPRCSRHDCPPAGSVVASPVTNYCGALPYAGNAWNTSQTSCTTATCGEYSLTKSCALSCAPSPKYQPFGATSSSYPNGSYCSEACPSGPEFVGTSPNVTEGACKYSLPTHGTSWTNNSSCQSNTRPATASQHGYTVTESCSLNCTNNYTPTNRTNTSSACCTQDCNANTWSNPGCPANPSNGYYSNGYSCQSNTCGDVSTAGSCTMGCNYDYHITGSSCTFNHNYNVSCGNKDANSSWVNGSTYTQDWYWWYGWSSASAHLGGGTCGYTCNSGYHSENNSSCISNTRSCGTAPANYHWINANETWNGSWSGCSSVCNNPPISYPTAPSCSYCGYSGSVTGDSCVGYSDSRVCNPGGPACAPIPCASPKRLYGYCYTWWCGGPDTRVCR